MLNCAKFRADAPAGPGSARESSRNWSLVSPVIAAGSPGSPMIAFARA
jgi:hypothetical protein